MSYKVANITGKLLSTLERELNEYARQGWRVNTIVSQQVVANGREPSFILWTVLFESERNEQ